MPVQRYLPRCADVRDRTVDHAITEATYVKTCSQREIEPFALDLANIFPATGGAPIETWWVAWPRSTRSSRPQSAPATDTNGDGFRDIGFGRRLTELGTRNSQSTRDFYRFVVGLEGKLFDDKFNWDMSYNFGQTSEQRTSNGQPNVLNFASALNAISTSTISTMTVRRPTSSAPTRPPGARAACRSISSGGIDHARSRRLCRGRADPADQDHAAGLGGQPFGRCV